MASPQDDFMKMFSEFKMPAMPDMSAFAEAQKRNIEALTTANKLAMEGAQAIARRNMEIMQQTMSEMSEAVQSMASQEPAAAKAAKQAEMLKAGYEKAVTNMREISELIQKSNGEALGVLNARFTTAMEEVKSLVAKG
jgi:phasin family protein